MQSRRSEPYPFEAVRDLLGLLRAFWLATDELNTRRREAIEAVARELREASELAQTSGRGTMGHNAAWLRTEEATARACQLVSMTDPLEPVVRVAIRRFTGGLSAGLRGKASTR